MKWFKNNKSQCTQNLNDNFLSKLDFDKGKHSDYWLIRKFLLLNKFNILYEKVLP